MDERCVDENNIQSFECHAYQLLKGPWYGITYNMAKCGVAKYEYWACRWNLAMMTKGSKDNDDANDKK